MFLRIDLSDFPKLNQEIRELLTQRAKAKRKWLSDTIDLIADLHLSTDVFKNAPARHNATIQSYIKDFLHKNPAPTLTTHYQLISIMIGGNYEVVSPDVLDFYMRYLDGVEYWYSGLYEAYKKDVNYMNNTAGKDVADGLYKVSSGCWERINTDI